MSYPEPYTQPAPEDQEPTPQHPMKWYKFLIYFSLWAGGIMNILGALPYLTGSIYEGAAEFVYAAFPKLKFLDLFLAIALIALGVFCIITRYSLANFEAKGPTLLMLVYAANIVVPVIYLAASYSIIDVTPEIDPETVGSLASSAIMIVVNKIYFDKRKDLFVN